MNETKTRRLATIFGSFVIAHAFLFVILALCYICTGTTAETTAIARQALSFPMVVSFLGGITSLLFYMFIRLQLRDMMEWTNKEEVLQSGIIPHESPKTLPLFGMCDVTQRPHGLHDVEQVVTKQNEEGCTISYCCCHCKSALGLDRLQIQKVE